MTSVSQATSPARSAPRRRSVVEQLRRGVTMETRIAIGLALLGLAITISVLVAPGETPFSSLSVPLILASILLSPRTLPWFVIYMMVLLTISTTQQTITSRTIGAVFVQFALGLIVLVTGFRRARLGVAGLQGESMFVDLRDRILAQAGIPDLPAGWTAESSLHSAGGTAFAGDFVVASRSRDGRQLQFVVVDVSGKGEAAGTRALLLSGAFAGLLGAVPPAGFLAAANDYLMRQDWEEGFATAVHVALDLETGGYQVWTAGHPPAALRRAATAAWSVLETDGPVLGLMDGAEFHGTDGTLAGGDTLLLYTDGMVEEPRRDIDVGIEAMLGTAAVLLSESVTGSTERLVRAVGSRHDDRCALVVQRSS